MAPEESTRARVILALVLAPLVAGVVSVARAWPEVVAGDVASRPSLWWFAPPSHRLRDRAAAELRSALRDLESPPEGDAREGEGYPAILVRCEAQLATALHGAPLDSRTMQLLASVRWELENLAGDTGHEETLRLIEIAEARSLHIPEVGLGLAQTLFAMGEPDRAVGLMRRIVERSPDYSQRVVHGMLGSGITALEIARALPDSPDVLVALKEPMLEAGLGSEFLEAAEREIATGPRRLLELYGEACLQLGVPARLAATVDALPASVDLELRAERACQRGYALFATGNAAAAADALGESRTLAPEDPRYAEVFATMSLEAGRARESEREFRKVLELCARLGGQTPRRARAYSGLGRSLEAQSNIDGAYDAYRRALALDPGLTATAERLARLSHGRNTR